VPPTEKRGRVQTSTITVAVLPLLDDKEVNLDDKDLEISTTRGSGPGGQHRNKVETEVIILHKPSGLKVRVGSERSQFKNKEIARNIIASKLRNQQYSSNLNKINETRKTQIGSGERGDKIRTIRSQDNTVVCEKTSRKIAYNIYIKGNIIF
jgi:peptide chain release factor 1